MALGTGSSLKAFQGSYMCMILFQKRPSEERVENALWKKVRKAGEDQYDFLSADIGIVHMFCTIWEFAQSRD